MTTREGWEKAWRDKNGDVWIPRKLLAQLTRAGFAPGGTRGVPDAELRLRFRRLGPTALAGLRVIERSMAAESGRCPLCGK